MNPSAASTPVAGSNTGQRMVALKHSTPAAAPAPAASSDAAASSAAPFGAKVTPKEPVVENKEAWVQTQQKTFTKWTNNHLRKHGYPALENAEVDFEDGIRLMQLVSALYGIPIPKHNAKPKMRPHKLDNIALAFKMVDEAKIKTNFLKSTHLIDHDLKMILGMMWAIILDYAIKGISEDDTTAKEGLLLWCRKKTAGYREIDPPTIQNFTTHWKNGLAFCALIHKHQPHLIDYDSLDKNDAAKNLELAFSVAESLGIPRLLDIEDMLVDKPDERSIMTQVSEYFHRFAQQDVKEVAARRAANFLGFTKKMNALKHDYESSAKALLEWVQSIIDRFANENFGSTLEESVAVTERLRSFILNEKPAKTAEKLDLESKYAEIQQTLLVHDRPAYECPKEFAPETIDSAFDALWDSEKKHATAARVQRFKFISKQENKVSEDKIKEMKDSYAHFDKDGDGAMDKVEFKAALSAMGVSLKNDEALQALLTKVSGGVGTISEQQWIAYNTELLTDKDTPDQIIQAFKTLADDRDTITADNMRIPPLTNEDVEYVQSIMPEQGGLDYVKFVNGSFVAKQ